jgi:phenylalanine-4-hydroxylase
MFQRSGQSSMMATLKKKAPSALTSLRLAPRGGGTLSDALAPFHTFGLTPQTAVGSEQRYETNQPVFIDCPVHESHPALLAAVAAVNSGGARKSAPSAQTKPAVHVVGSWSVPWFPQRPADLDLLEQESIEGCENMGDPENQHPIFNCPQYKARRAVIQRSARRYRHGAAIESIAYTADEDRTWQVGFDTLAKMLPRYGCRQHNANLPLLLDAGVFHRDRVPQLQPVSDFMMAKTGWSIRPAAGLLGARDFFAALAHRVFFSTQYVRHHSTPLYTPEPDVVHELMGHVPMLLDPDFADFSQAFGLLSLGADDATIEKLGFMYWFSIEFGVCAEGAELRAYGAGLLSSFGELGHAMSDVPAVVPWDPAAAAVLEHPLTTYQPTYFKAESFADARDKLLAYGRTLNVPCDFVYDRAAKRISMEARRDAC